MIDPEALRRLKKLLDRAARSPLREPTACTLATATAEGRPSARTVLLKGLDEEGLTFYTNLTSRKAQELKANPRVALLFFWQPFMEQVSVEGEVRGVSDEEADRYWATRPRLSQIGAWASLQSQPLPSRRVLSARVAQFTLKFAGKKIPRPPHWSGFRLLPDRIEFWKKRAFRLHERVLYERSGERWEHSLLYP